MKILYISSLIFQKSSSAAIRNVGLVKGIVDLGHEIDILTIENIEEKEDKFLRKYLGHDIKIYQSKLKIVNNYLKKEKQIQKKNKIKEFIKNKIKDIYFFPDVHKEWIHSFKDNDIDYSLYDLIISSSDTKTSHFIAMEIIKKNNIKWYQIWGDPWEDDVNLKNINRLLKWRIKKAENTLIKKAEKVFYVSPITAQRMKSKIKLNKIKYLPRGYLLKTKSEKTNDYKEKYNFVYTGVLNDYRNITGLLKEIELYNSKNYKQIELKIYGSLSENKIKELKNYNFVKMYGVKSFLEIIEIYKEADVLIFLDNGKETTQIPGKIYDYLGTDRKILALFEYENDVYNYFKTELDVKTCLVTEIDLEKILEVSDREVDSRFSNKNIAKQLLEE